MADKKLYTNKHFKLLHFKNKTHHFHILNVHISVLSFRKDMCSLSHA